MSRKELQTNRSYQIKFYEGYHCVQLSCATKAVIEELLDEHKTVEVYEELGHYTQVR